MTAGKTASMDSFTPFVEPGRANTRVNAIKPETDFENIE